MSIPRTPKTFGLIFVLAFLALTVLYSGFEYLRPERGYRRTLSELLYKQGCPPITQNLSFLQRQLDTPVRFVVDFYGLKYEGTFDNFIDAQILFYGAYEKPILYFLRDVMLTNGSDGTFVDVGANTGQHSLFISRYSAEVHAFEPYPPVLARFKRMILLNGIQNIKVHPIGLGEKKAKVPFYQPPSLNLGTGSFLSDFSASNVTGDLELEIGVGDNEFDERGISDVDLLKIDIEGYEKLALRGLRKTLMAHRPIVEMELRVRPTIPTSFRSEQELRLAFPQGYRFLVFDEPRSDPGMGYYYLRQFDFNFAQPGQYNLVVYPQEKSILIDRSNADG